MADYNKLKVVELKEILKERGIPSTGLSRKQQIVEALQAHDAKQGDDHAPENVDGDGDETVENENNEEQAADVTTSDAPVEASGEDVNAEQQPGMGVEDAGDAEPIPSEPSNVPKDEQQETSPANPVADLPASASPLKEPTVLEHGQPVSSEPPSLATPPQTSSLPKSQSPSSRKRKLRSPTPPPSTESVAKKLKAAEDAVILPEDTAMKDAPVSEAVDTEMDLQHEKSADDPPSLAEDVAVMEDQVDNIGQKESTDDVHIPPAIHPATRALYIRELVRPIQPQQLRDHLEKLATPTSSTTAGPNVETLHLGSIRTHAFAVFGSIAAAARARSGLHNRIWPDEPARKPLWVDFVPEEDVERWIGNEVDSGSGRRDTRRWEVIYDETADGMTATHQEITSSTSAPRHDGARQLSMSQPPGILNAPSGPRGTQESFAPTSTQQSDERPSLPPTEQPSKESFDVLDQRFNFTTTKPKLYYLPISKDLVDKRLDEIDSQTSRDWGDGRTGPRNSGGIGSQMRRYTFEDGDRLVDGGPDIGSFGRRGPPQGGRFRGSRYRGGR